MRSLHQKPSQHPSQSSSVVPADLSRFRTREIPRSRFRYPEQSSDGEVTLPLPESSLIHAVLPRSVSGLRIVQKVGLDESAGIYVVERALDFGVAQSSFGKWLPRSAPDYEEARDGLLAEARLCCGMSHPNLLGLRRADEDDEGLLLQYEHVTGTNLGRLNAMMRRRRQALPFEIAVFVVVEILRGIEYLHGYRREDGSRLGLTARGLAPFQVLIQPSGQIRLASFALGIQAAGSRPAEFRSSESVYQAPECIQGGVRTPSADLYTVAVMLGELLSGRQPLSGVKLAELRARVAAVDVGFAALEEDGVPEHYAAIVRRGTGPAKERYQEAAEMMHDLLAGAHPRPVTASAPLAARFFAREGLMVPDEEAFGPAARSSSRSWSDSGSHVGVGVDESISPVERPKIRPTVFPDHSTEDALSVMILEERSAIASSFDGRSVELPPRIGFAEPPKGWFRWARRSGFLAKPSSEIGSAGWHRWSLWASIGDQVAGTRRGQWAVGCMAVATVTLGFLLGVWLVP